MKHLNPLRDRTFVAFTKSMLLCIVSCVAGITAADDTEVFFGSGASSGETRPNVMFVLDTSGSMGNHDGGSETRLDRMKDAVKRMLESDVDMNIGLMNYSGSRGGGPVLYPITTLHKEVCAGFDCGEPGEPASNVYLVDGSGGDVEEVVSSGEMLTTGNYLDLAKRFGWEPNAVGLRYAGINIARGAKILEARMEFVAINDQETPSNMTIRIEDVADSQPYDSSDYAVSSRNYLSDTVAWSPDEWYDKSWFQSADVGSLVEDIVGRDDWCTGNSLAFYITGTGGGRGAYTYEKATTDNVDYIPRLRIVQEPASPVISEDNCLPEPVTVTGTVEKRIASTYGSDSSDDVEYEIGDSRANLDSGDLDLDYSHHDTKLVGLRFRDIAVPQGATITSAYIKLTYEDYNGGSMNLDISAENTVKSATYGRYNGPTHTGRSYLPTKVAWNNVPALYKGHTTDSPNLKYLVQVLVSKTSWKEHDNAISFQLKPTGGSGKREFESFEGSSSKAPKLVITYTKTDSGPITPSVPVTPATPAYSGVPLIPVYSTKKAREEMLSVVDQLYAAHATPTVDAFYEAARYMRGEGVDYGKQRGIDDDYHPRERFRVSHENSYTGGSLVQPEGCTDDNLDSTACRTEYISGNPTYISPMLGSCQANHIVLLSDGETNNNSSTSKILDMTGKAACTDTGDEACATDLASWLLATDHSALSDFQNITTHTIAFNLDGAGKTFLERVAKAGGGKSYEADSSDELLEVFNNLVSTVIDVDTGFTAPAATVNQFNRLSHREDLYFAVFKPSGNAVWDGNVKRFRLGKDNDGNGEELIRDFNGAPAIDETTGLFKTTAQSWWKERNDDGIVLTKPDGNTVARGGAANQLALTGLDTIGNRRVYTWLSDASTAISTPIDLTVDAQALHEDNALITDEILDILGTAESDTEQEAYKEKLIKWARGVDVDDIDKDGSTTDIRKGMGDPMHSRPVVVNYAPKTANGDVRSLLFVGTNEGYLHAVDTSNGQEQFAFIPYELLSNLDNFFNNVPGIDRPYGLDGDVTVWRDDKNNDQIVDAGESAYLFIGMRRGGSSYYALNITDPAKPKLAWTIKGGSGGTTGFESMGQTWSRPTPVKMYIAGEGVDVLVFGGGYDENQDRGVVTASPSHTTDTQGTAIYIVNARTGKRLWSGLGKNGGSKKFNDMLYGFNGNIRTIDINRDGYVDQMYAADAGGQLWRFDITQYHTNVSDDLVEGGVIADFSGSAASDHRRFYNEPDVALIEGGGERFLSVSIGSGWRAHPLDEITQDRFYMVRQYAVYEKPDWSNVTKITESDLIDVSNSLNPATNTYGWYLDLPGTGEKVLGTSVTFDDKVIFSSYVPTTQADACSAEVGSGRAYIMDAASGAPVVNLDDTINPATGEPPAVLTLADRSMELHRGGIPPEAMVFISEENPHIIIGGEKLETGIENNTRRTFWSDEGESGEIVLTGSEDE